MKTKIFFFLIINIFGYKIAHSQTLTVINETNKDFKTVLMLEERDTARNVNTFSMGTRFSGVKNKFPMLKIDTVKYTEQLKIKVDGTYTFKFIDSRDSIFSVYGIDTKTHSKLVLDSTNLIPDIIEEKVMVFDGTFLHFDFKNRTESTVYAIYSKLNSDSNYKHSILNNHPDNRLVPGEARTLLVDYTRSESEYIGRTINFLIISVDQYGNVTSHTLNEISPEANEVIITMSNKE